jgi:glyoxylase I family protein
VNDVLRLGVMGHDVGHEWSFLGVTMQMPTEAERPALGGFHHFSPTVSDIEASAQWYERVFKLGRVPPKFPHFGAEDSGYAVLLMDPATGIAIGLHHHENNGGEPADETRTGLDHMAFSVPSRSDLDSWAAWLDSLGVMHSEVTDTDNPIPYSVLVFRDPDNVQLELIYLEM